MPRDHGRVLCAIWRDKDFRARSVEAQRLYMLLLSQPNVNNAGVMPLQVSKWAKGCDDTKAGDIESALDELADHEFVFFDEDTEECLVRSFMRNDGVLKHKYIWSNALRCAEQTESAGLRAVLASELRKVRRKDADLVADRLIGVPPEPDPDGIPMAPECHSDDQSHSDGVPIPRGRGKGKGEGSPSVVGSVGEQQPSEFCSKHPNGTDKNCFACGQARRDYPELIAVFERCRREAAAATRQAAIDDCLVCDEFGDITFDDSVRKCDHRAAAHA